MLLDQIDWDQINESQNISSFMTKFNNGSEILSNMIAVDWIEVKGNSQNKIFILNFALFYYIYFY